MRVDLPAELSPTRPRTSPGNSRRSTSASARTGPKALLILRISMMGCPGELFSSGTRAPLQNRLLGEQAFKDRPQGGCLAEPDIADHGEDEDETDKDIDPMLGQHKGCSVGANDLKRKQAAQESDDGSTGKRADDGAEPAEYRTPADTHRCDGVKFPDLAGGRDEVLVERNVDNARK